MFNSRHYEEAVSCFEKVFLLKESVQVEVNLDNRYTLALAYHLQGQMEKAIELYQDPYYLTLFNRDSDT